MRKLYKKPPSPYWWIKYLDFESDPPKWKLRSTGYKMDSNLRNPPSGSDTVRAVALLRRTVREEEVFLANRALTLGKPSRATHPWSEWVSPLINRLWGGRHTSTFGTNTRYWSNVLEFFNERGISHPGLVDGDVIRAYLPWRKKNGAGANTAIAEIGGARQLQLEISDSYNSRFLGKL